MANERRNEMKAIVVYMDGSKEIVELAANKKGAYEACVLLGTRINQERKAAGLPIVSGLSASKGYVWTGSEGDGDIFNEAIPSVKMTNDLPFGVEMGL
jgi:hypothetical protein